MDPRGFPPSRPYLPSIHQIVTYPQEPGRIFFFVSISSQPHLVEVSGRVGEITATLDLHSAWGGCANLGFANSNIRVLSALTSIWMLIWLEPRYS